MSKERPPNKTAISPHGETQKLSSCSPSFLGHTGTGCIAVNGNYFIFFLKPEATKLNSLKINHKRYVCLNYRSQTAVLFLSITVLP